MGLLVAVSCALLSLGVGHKAPLDAAREQLDEASFEKAIAIADAALKGMVSDAERAALQLLRAEAFSALQRVAPMKDALDAALRADADARYDEANTKPELLEALAAARRKFAGKVSVGPPPSGTPPPEVLLDGESLGKAPLEATAAVGRHQISLVWSASARSDSTVVIRTDAVTAVAVVPVADVMPQPKPVVETAAVAPAPAAKPGFRWPLIPLAAGAAVAVAGGVCLVVSGANYGALTDPNSTLTLNRTQAQAFADQNQAAQGVGIAFVSVGLAAAAFGGAFLLFGLDQPKLVVAPSANGAAVVFSGPLP